MYWSVNFFFLVNVIVYFFQYFGFDFEQLVLQMEQAESFSIFAHTN